jgi:hypothetical protein
VHHARSGRAILARASPGTLGATRQIL